MAIKPLAKLVPDFKEALAEGTKASVEDITDDLIEIGPFWSGVFAASWLVKRGKKSIPAHIPGSSVNIKNRKPEGSLWLKYKEKLKPFVPDNDDLEGYTIGNMTKYKWYAMDLLPTKEGRKMGYAEGITAEKDWYLRYVHSGGMKSTVEKALTNVFKRY